MKRLGTVSVFKPEVTRAEAEAAMAKLRALLDPGYFLRPKPPIHEFDDEDGGPVWYIP